ncbi:hypothetical protein [Dactylosporangium sp. CS-033363]
MQEPVTLHRIAQRHTVRDDEPEVVAPRAIEVAPVVGSHLVPDPLEWY